MDNIRISKILDYKTITKEQVEMELKKLRLELNSELEKLFSLEESYNKFSEDFANKKNDNNVDSTELETFYNYFNYLDKMIDRQKKVIATKMEEIREKEALMLEAYKEKKLLEILKENIMKEEVKEAIKSEQKEIDFNFIRRRYK